MNQQALYIAFGHHQVAVSSNVPEIVADLQCSFKQMLSSHSNGVVAYFEAWETAGKYGLKENQETRIEAGTVDDVLGLLKYQVALHLIQTRLDLLWLHAGAVAYQENVVLISGLSGRGKSTIVTGLCAQGCTYLSDDIIPVDQTSDKAIPFPQTPMVRENPRKEIPDNRVHNLPKVEFLLKPEMVCREILPIKAIIFPEFKFQGNNELVACSPAVAAVGLIQNSLNYVHHRGVAVSYLVELVKRVPAYNLSFSDGKRAAQMITQICRQGQLFTQAIPKVVLK